MVYGVSVTNLAVRHTGPGERIHHGHTPGAACSSPASGSPGEGRNPWPERRSLPGPCTRRRRRLAHRRPSDRCRRPYRRGSFVRQTYNPMLAKATTSSDGRKESGSRNKPRRGRTAKQVAVRHPYSTLFISSMAFWASDSCVYRTNPNPRLRPVSRSLTTTFRGTRARLLC